MKRLLVFAYVLLSFGAMAQLNDLEITWGEPFETPKRSFITGLVYSDSNGVFGVREKYRLGGHEYYMEKYVDLVPQDMVRQEDANRRALSYSREIIKIGRDLWELTYEGTRDEKKLVARYFNMETLKPSGDEIEIFNIPLLRKLRYTYGTFSFNFSEDLSNTVFVTEYPGDYDEEGKIGVQVRDDLFYVEWERELTLPYPKERVDLEYSDVNDDGLAIFMLKVYDEGRFSKSRRGVDYWYEMLTLDSLGASNTYKLSLDDKVIHSGHFEVVNNTMLVCSGFYGEQNFQIDGSFYMQVDLSSGDLQHISTKKFDLSFLQEGQSEGRAKRIKKRADAGKNTGLLNIYFRDFVLRSDGGVILIGEYYDLIVNTSSDINSTSTTTSYIYKDIVIVNINADGEVAWTKKILKRQITSDDGGLMSGFALFVHDEKMYFIFNDHEDNLEAKDYNDLRTWSRKRRTSIVCLVTVDAYGNMTREAIITQKELNLELIPESCIQISEDEMMLVAYKRKENQIARLVAK